MSSEYRPVQPSEIKFFLRWKSENINNASLERIKCVVYCYGHTKQTLSFYDLNMVIECIVIYISSREVIVWKKKVKGDCRIKDDRWCVTRLIYKISLFL